MAHETDGSIGAALTDAQSGSALALGDVVTPEAQARMLAEHMEAIAKLFDAWDRVLADKRRAVAIAEQLAAGSLRWPAGGAWDALRGDIERAASAPVQLEVLRIAAQSMAVLSELARTTIATARGTGSQQVPSETTGAG